MAWLDKLTGRGRLLVLLVDDRAGDGACGPAEVKSCVADKPIDYFSSRLVVDSRLFVGVVD